MKNIFTLIIALLFLESSFSQSTDKKLFKKVSDAVTDFNGDVGIYIKIFVRGKQLQ